MTHHPHPRTASLPVALVAMLLAALASVWSGDDGVAAPVARAESFDGQPEPRRGQPSSIWPAPRVDPNAPPAPLPATF